MKNIAILSALFLAVACTKSETQYKDQENKKESVNNPQSDTIKTLPEVSNTSEIQDSGDVKTGYE